MSEADPVLDAMRRHRSIRDFRPEPVPDAHTERAVEAAQCAATSSWIQAYHLLQVTDPAERADLARLAGGQPQVEGAGAFFVISGDTRRHRLLARREGAPYANSAELFVLATVDASLFAQNLTLAFESMGYGTCYIGGIRNRLAEVDRLLELPEGVFPLFGLCVGVPASDPGTRPRLPARAIWSQGRYPSDGEVMASVDAFDERSAAYYEERGAPGRNWSGGVWRKFRRPLRPDLRGFYDSKGASFD